MTWLLVNPLFTVNLRPLVSGRNQAAPDSFLATRPDGVLEMINQIKMKNTLKSAEMGLVDIPRSESGKINGGWLLPTVLFLATLLVHEWESTKKAAVDAWNGSYNPPA